MYTISVVVLLVRRNRNSRPNNENQAQNENSRIRLNSLISSHVSDPEVNPEVGQNTLGGASMAAAGLATDVTRRPCKCSGRCTGACQRRSSTRGDESGFDPADLKTHEK